MSKLLSVQVEVTSPARYCEGAGVTRTRTLRQHLSRALKLAPLRQIRVEEAEHVRVIDHADAFALLQLGDLRVEIFHLCPMHLRPPMMLGMVAVVEEEPV